MRATAGACFTMPDVLCCTRMKPGIRDVREQNEAMQRRQDEFRIAARYVSHRFASLGSVRKVAIIGSVAVPLKKEVPRFREYRRHGIEVLHECSDLDLAVWISDLSDLKSLQRCRRQALDDLAREQGITLAHHQVEVFLLEPGTDRYVGRLCIFGRCPKDKPECRVPGCGATQFLRHVADFHFNPDVLVPDRSITLFDRSEKDS